MSLFVCQQCGTIENTALSRFWGRGDAPALCSACHPEIAQWHGRFTRRRFDGSQKVQWHNGAWLDAPSWGDR